MRKYRTVISRIKCKYCKRNKETCRHKCPEIKDTNVYPNHKRHLFNLIKKEFNFAVILVIKKINSDIMVNKNRRGRFRDYAQKRVVKAILTELIKRNKINPNLSLKLIIRIDQQGTSTDTNRMFTSDIHNELVNGTYNYNYRKTHEPILFSKLEIDLKYVLSHRHICIQASDFIAGKTRKAILVNNKKLEFLDIKLILP